MFSIIFCINISALEMKSVAITINNVIAGFVGLILIIAPLAITFKLWRGWSKAIETKPDD